MSWKPESIRQGLTFLALYSGNAGLASRAAKEETGDIFPPATLRKWRDGEHKELYDELRSASAEMAESLIRDTLETARMAASAERLAIEKAHADLAAGDCKDPARAARDLSHIKATNVEKFLLLTGRPTEVVRHETPDDIWAGLVNDGVVKPVAELPAGESKDMIVIDLPDEAVEEIRGLFGDPS